MIRLDQACCSCSVSQLWVFGTVLQNEKNRKDLAGSIDTASKIIGGGYVGARTWQGPMTYDRPMRDNPISMDATYSALWTTVT